MQFIISPVFHFHVTSVCFNFLFNWGKHYKFFLWLRYSNFFSVFTVIEKQSICLWQEGICLCSQHTGLITAPLAPGHHSHSQEGGFHSFPNKFEAGRWDPMVMSPQEQGVASLFRRAQRPGRIGYQIPLSTSSLPLLYITCVYIQCN